MAWTYPVKEYGPGKVVYHRCGYPLWVRVKVHMGPVTPFLDGPSHAPLSTDGSILVEYRMLVDGGPGLAVFQCPQCQKVLKLWWHVEPASDEEVG
jgi:hypothetical protein